MEIIREKTVHDIHSQIKNGTLTDKNDIYSSLALLNTTDLSSAHCKKYSSLCITYEFYDLLMYHLPYAKTKDTQSSFRQVLASNYDFNNVDKKTMYYHIWGLMRRNKIKYDKLLNKFIHLEINKTNFVEKSQDTLDITDKTKSEITALLQNITDNYNVYLAGGKVGPGKSSETMAKSMNVKDIFGQKNKVSLPQIPPMSEKDGKTAIKILKKKNLNGESKNDNSIKCYFYGILLWHTKDKKNKNTSYEYFLQGSNMGCKFCTKFLKNRFNNDIVYQIATDQMQTQLKINLEENPSCKLDESIVRNIIEVPDKPIRKVLIPYADHFYKSLLRTYLLLLDFDIESFQKKYDSYEHFESAIDSLFIF